MTIDAMLERIETLDKATTPGPWMALAGGTPMEPDDPTRWAVVTKGAVHYCIASIENGAPGDCLETEIANAEIVAAARTLLPLCAKLLRIYEKYAKDRMDSTDLNDLRAELQAAMATGSEG